MSGLHDCRKAFSDTLVALAEADARIVAVANDSIGSSNLKEFKKRFPERLVNVGIAEQNMVGIAAGLANGGLVPFVCAASCFLTGRALEQVKVDLGYSRSNVKLCGMSSGVAYGELGPTHHSIEDLAWTRVIANMTVVVPADPFETAAALRAAAACDGPVFLRLSRIPVPQVHPDGYEFAIGRAARLRTGSDLTLIANGTMVCRALEAASLLEKDGIRAAVVNLSTIRPLDRQAILEAAVRGPIVTIEEHSVVGGLGGAVAEVVVETHPVRMRLLGFPGEFAPTGSPAFLFEHFGLTPEGIRKAAVQLVEESAGVARNTHPRG
jgi:transketolase